MIKPNYLSPGNRIAIVSLSSGMLGEESCSHNITIGAKRMEEFGLTPVFMPNSLKGEAFLAQHPEKRAEDLKQAFLDDSIQGIITAIGGDDTFRLLPYLMEDKEFIQAVKDSPKLFLGFSDTTVNHLMFHRIGLQTFYGQAFLCELAEIAEIGHPLVQEGLEHIVQAVGADALLPQHTGQLVVGGKCEAVEEAQDFQSKLLLIIGLLYIPLHQHIFRERLGLARLVMEYLLVIVVERESLALFSGNVDFFGHRGTSLIRIFQMS